MRKTPTRQGDRGSRLAAKRDTDPLPIVHFVGGFLGSGKTTSIVGACRRLAARGVRTAIVTNDQGRRQVDEAFARSAGVPAVGVSDGCLCCRYDDFETRLFDVAHEARPEVIFAESVGSCADIVATVVKPFAAFRAAHRPRGVLSSFVDIRLVEARLSGVRLPFSDNVLYIFDKQLEEADLIVVNKRDRYDLDRGEAVRTLVRERYPESTVLLQSAFEESDLERWLTALDEGVDTHETVTAHKGGRRLSPAEVKKPAMRAASSRTPFALDYERYAAGEREMAWLDEEIAIDAPVPLGAVSAFFSALVGLTRDGGATIAHIKCHVTAAATHYKLSWTVGDEFTEHRGEAPRTVDRETMGTEELVAPIRVTVNVRAVAAPHTLEAAVDGAVAVFTDAGIAARSEGRDVFRPGYPEPVHRMT